VASIYYEYVILYLQALELVLRDQILSTLLFKIRLRSSYLLERLLDFNTTANKLIKSCYY